MLSVFRSKALGISIHAPTRGATCSGHKIFYTGSKFQSTLPRGERRLYTGSRVYHYIFQSTLPRGERRKALRSTRCIDIFQSTLPRGERPQYRTIIHSIVYFNPRSHEGSDGNMLLQLLSTVISIHAPTRGATYYRCHHLQPSQFQSTLPRGERHKRPLFFVCEANFNPRSHEGSDQTLSSVRCSPQISIHAPTRGATDNIIDEQRDELFQSTLPRGERP